MTSSGNERFITYDELSILLPTTALEVSEELEKYIFFAGFVMEKSSPLGLYIDGYVIPDITINENFFSIISSVEITTHCNKKELVGNKYLLKKPLSNEAYISHPSQYLDYSADEYGTMLENGVDLILPEDPTKIFYRLEEVELLCKKHQIHIDTNKLEANINSNFNYDLDFISRKSYFTIRELTNITVNQPLFVEDDKEDFEVVTSRQYNQSLILIIEATAKNNQDGYRIQPTDLWINKYDEFEGEYIRQIDNCINLIRDREINIDKTTISKSELLRWCDYQEIYTGIVWDFKEYQQSVDFLKFENEELLLRSKNNDLTINELKSKIEILSSKEIKSHTKVEPLGNKKEETYLTIIGSLSIALSNLDSSMNKNGEPFIGYSQATGNRGIVGYLKENKLSELGSSTLVSHIKKGIELLK